ncbi:MAG: CPBP family intramembrane metalloprotease [Lachnospiraceae bacterium]|nr:CPBP family intramembrane metalloprotease [Lachnospiraceae bacterium]
MEQNTVKQNRKYLSKIGICYFIGTIIIIALQLGLGNICATMFPDIFEKYGFLVMMLPMYIIAVPITVFMLTRIRPVVTIEKKKFSVKKILGFFLVSYAGMYISNILGNYLATVISMVKQGQVQNSIIEIATSNELWMNALVMVICAPIAEELLFRKLIIDRTVQFGEKLAILLSALMFGFYHGNIYQFCYAFVLGCVFGYVYAKSGKVIYTIVLHMMINFLGSIASLLVVKASGLTKLMDGSITDPNEMVSYLMGNLGGLAIFGVYFLVIIGLVIAGIIILAVNFKNISLQPASDPIEKGQVFKTVALNVGMGLFFIFWIVFMIYATLI